jgi:peptide-methionine (S)-S-oxide reductase
MEFIGVHARLRPHPRRIREANVALLSKSMNNHESIVLGAGCFWGVEDALRLVPGVVSTRVGYTGGGVAEPTYEQVCGGGTGHAEAVEVTFDPTATTLEDVLWYFWNHHVATGHNVGQYRSIIVCDADQLARVHAIRTEFETMTRGEVVTTQILTRVPFYEAEEYHQQYYEKGREVVREVRRQCGLPPEPGPETL